MRTNKLPGFIRPPDLDQLILDGESIYITVQCRDCGVFGVYDEWAMGTSSVDGRLCPGCGHYTGERIG